MKKIALFFGLMALFMQTVAFAQSDSVTLFKRKDPSWPLYERKVQTYRKLKTTGILMGVSGAILTVAGISMVSSADWYQTSSYGYGTQYTTNDGSGATGVFFILAGVPLTTAGTILGIIGGRKVKYYQKKLDGLSINMRYAPQQQGVFLSYRF